MLPLLRAVIEQNPVGENTKNALGRCHKKGF